ncbi:MAG: Hpt domain-containing protein [Treponema sp.]|nr:Hpt domain-containing protein [Treponema sp.]
MAIEIPGLDVDSGLNLCDGNMKIYLNSLRLFVSSTPASLEKMQSVSQETLEKYSVTAHSVKSMSEYAGAEEVRKTAKELEALAKAGDLAGVLAKNAAFIKYAGGIVDGVRNWLTENHPE